MPFFSGDAFSSTLMLTTHVNVIIPDESLDATPLREGEPSVLYLLHGLGANADEWCRFSRIEYFAKTFNLVVVMPEVQRSFYTDRGATQHWFTYVADELPGLVGQWLRVPTDREHTLIAGESMGGYGALKAALSRPERFGGAASLSGVLDVAAFRDMVVGREFEDMSVAEVEELFPAGPIAAEDDLFSIARTAAKADPHPFVYLTWGAQDPFAGMNREFSGLLDELGYEHKSREAPGEHAWTFWDGAIQRAIHALLGYPEGSMPLV